jgi:hypothetical protein
MYQWMNHVRAGYFGSLSWASLLLLVVVFSGTSASETLLSNLTLAMLAGMLPSGLVCAAVSYYRYRYSCTQALAAFRSASPDTPLRQVWRWSDVESVEMVARICRTRDDEDDEKQDEASVKLAERLYKGGMAFFSGKAQMVILYANFMIEVNHQSTAGQSQLVAAKNLKPSIVEQVEDEGNLKTKQEEKISIE